MSSSVQRSLSLRFEFGFGSYVRSLTLGRVRYDWGGLPSIQTHAYWVVELTP